MGVFVVVFELVCVWGKCGGVVVVLFFVVVMLFLVLVVDIVVYLGEIVNGGILVNYDNQIVFGMINGMIISIGLEYGLDNEVNIGG